MLKWFKCPDGQLCDITTCLSARGCRMGARCQTWSFLQTAGEQRKWNGIPSVTQLIKGTCEAYLDLTKDYSANPDDFVFRVIGTKAHNKLAREHPDKFIEERLIYNGISGQFDEYDTEDGVNYLRDYKTSGSYKVAQTIGLSYHLVQSDEKYLRKTKVKQADGTEIEKQPGEFKMKKEFFIDPSRRDAFEYDMQLNMYRIMLEDAGFTVDKMQLVFLVRDGGTFMAEDRGITRKSYLVDVPRLDDCQTWEYFLDKKIKLQNALQNASLPEKCSDRETWDGVKCEKFCSVREHCPFVKKGGN